MHGGITLSRDVVTSDRYRSLKLGLQARSGKKIQRLALTIWVVWGLAAFGLMGSSLFLAHPVQADDEDRVTVVTGTDTADTMTPAGSIDAQAGLLTDESETIEAAATALDALAGNDVILSGADVTANADATALLLQILDAKTQALAKTMGLVAGDDNDTLTSSGSLAVTAVANGAYAGALSFDSGDRDGDDRKIDLSLSTEAASTVMDAGDGDDTVNNDGTLAADATATSGGMVGGTDYSLSADAQGAVSLTSTSSAKAAATGIAAGDGDDQISSTDPITSIATATSGALGLGLAAGENAEGDKVNIALDASATAEASAIGIESDGDDVAEEDKEASPFGLDGLRVTYTKETTAVSGTDTLTNSADVQVTATATSGAGSASIDVAADGAAQTKANAEAKAESIGLSTGAAQDTIINSGDLNAVSTATAGALSATFQIGAPTSDGDPPPTTDDSSENNASSQSDVKATARAVGIASDGEGQFKTIAASAEITDTALVTRYQQSEGTMSDADQVINTGDIGATATATAGAASAAIDIAAGGSVESKANAEATSASVAIFTGGGDDDITNTGVLDAISTATADALSVGLAVAESQQGDDTGDQANDPGSVKSETEVKATATAKGIDTEGDAQSKSVAVDVDISRSGIEAGFDYRQEAASGNDTVDNQADVTAVSTAAAGSGSAAIDIMAGGSVESKANAEATSASVAIFTGAGDDTVANTGALGAVATSTAGAVSVSLGISDSSDQDDDGGILDNLQERFWPTVHSEANATATATAQGIDTEGAVADKSIAGDLSLDRQSLDLLFAHEETQAGGNDLVENQGAINAVATATSGAGGVDIQINSDGTAAAEANSTATAQADAIRTGSGDDTVNNSGALTSVATATSGALSVGVAHADGDDTKARAEAKATSTAQATGIDTEGDNDSHEVDFSLDLSRDGLHVNYNDTKTAAIGNDEVVNQAAVTTVATASSGAAAVPVSIDGAASADVTSKATAAATAIHTGGGHDVIDNSGDLAAASQATSAAIGVGFGQQTQSTGKTKVEVKAAAESTASAMGIATDGDAGDHHTAFSFSLTNEGLVSGFSKSQTAIAGDDTLTNTGNVTTAATASSGSAGVAVAIDGAAAVDITSATKAVATGIDTGGGNDTIDNQGDITSTATATSMALGVGVGVQNGSSSDASSNVEAAANSEALAVGMTADGHQQDTALEIDLVITEDGLSAGYHQAKTPLAGDDFLTNTGAVNAVATATSGAGAVAVTTEGSARSDASATAKADARALDLGGGSDTVDNHGALSAVATATAAAVEVSVSGKGTTIANNGLFSAGTTADARAVGIAGAGMDSAQSLDVTLDIDFDELSVGFDFEKVVDGIEGDGDDTITNTAGITTVATATAPEVSVAVTSEGIAASLASTEATAEATAIRSGHGDDTITTSGDLSATATATAAAVNVAVTGKGLAVAGNSVWDGGIQADAQAAGIHSEGGERNTLAIAVDASLDGVAVTYEKTKELASGEDTVINDGDIAATAVAVAPEVSVAVSSQGVAASLSTSTASAEAFGIRTGDAGDDITNRGNIAAVANADAVAVNVAVAPTGGSVAGNNFWDGGTTAKASAFGIDADGETASETQTRFTADGSGAAFAYDHHEILASGDDEIRNEGDVTAVAVSVAPALSVAVTAEGVAAAMSTATATSDARAIRGGDGDDLIENTGHLTAVSNADAFAVNVSVVPTGGVSAAGNNFWDGGNKAEALAIGIDGDGENYSTSGINVDVNGTGVGIEQSSSNQMAGGDDRIVNSGDVDITAVAVSPSIATAVTVAGVSAAISTAKANADARAIRGGDGSDTIENAGNLNVFANADAAAVNVSVNAGGGVALAADAIWDGGTTAEAKALGIDAEGESSSASTTTISIGSSVDYDQDKTEDQATGDDIVDNQGAIDVLAIAVAPSVAVSVVGTGGVAGAFSTATAKADSTAISTGAGSDTITNSGFLTADTIANADAVSVSVTGVGGVSVSGNNVWDGGTRSEAKSRGIDSGSGDDDIEDNSGNISATATAVTASGAVSVVGVGGVAGAISTATATSDSAAIDTGDGDDEITSSGNLTSAATAIAAAANVSVTGVGGVSVSGNNAWDGGTLSEAKSRGIDSGDGDDFLENSGDISASATTVTATGSVSVTGVGGVSGAISTSTAKSDAVAIAMGAGEDEVDNSGALNAEAFANADGLNVAVTGVGGVSVAGNNAWDGGTLAAAKAAGIDGGDGEARIANTSSVTAAADAISVSAALSYVTFGVPLAISTSTADAEAAAIRSGDQDDELTNSGDLTVATDATAVSVNVAVTGAGVAGAGDSVWDGGTKAMATSVGMDARAGEDRIHNTGTIDVDADAVTSSNSVAFTVAGVAGAVSTSTATADATALSGGDGDDRLINEGALDSTADATAVSVSFAASAGGAAIAADAVWDGGTTAEAHASGLDGGLGDDIIQNTAQVDASATSTASSNSVAMTVAGVSGATSTATSTATAAAIDAGTGDDVVRSDGALSSIADAGATSVSVAVTNAGVAMAADSFWDGGTRATADATGIALGAGDDNAASTESIHAEATAHATSVAVAATFSGGLAGAVAASTATSQAAGMQGGAGEDVLVNAADLTAETLSEAQGVSVTFTPLGASVAGAYIDNATTADALSIGLAGDSGNDVIANEEDAAILLEAEARTTNTAVALSLAGMSAAESTAIASAAVVGLDGGADNDTVVNSGTIRSDLLHADAVARAVTFTALGLGDATANALGHAAATGLSGGAGDDRLENAGVVDLNPHARSIGQSVSVAIGGAAIGEANADALAQAAGIEGGSGEDTIVNTGEISLDALASTTVRSIAATAVGYSLGQANANATASVTGLAGGDQDDTIVSAESGHIGIVATADTVATSVSITVAGAADGEARTLPKATAVGLTGDGGNDLVVNQGALEVLALSRSSASSSAISVAGSASAKAGTEVETTATGMSGGDGEDILMNTGILRVGPADGATGDARWMSLLDTEASSFGFAGSTNAESSAFARTTSTGITGGDDDDQIGNTGEITVVASALNRSSSETVTIFGSSGAAGASGAFTVAQGLSGGQGDDRIDNGGNLTVDANAELLLDGSSYTFGGSGDTGGVLAALTRVEGIAGDEGEDSITNSGRLDVDARAALNSSGESEATFGGSSASVVSGGQSYAAGITGGEDNDLIENSAGGRVDVRSSTEVTTESIAYTFGGGSGTDAILTGEAVAVGLDAGLGNDRLTSQGVVEVVAEAALQSTGGAKNTISFTSDSESTGQSMASAQAFGLDGGAGDDTIVTSGQISVRAEVAAEALNEARSGASITSDNQVGAITRATADAVGLSAGDGTNLVANDSDLTVTADSTAYAFAYASGASVSFDGDGLTRAESHAAATATGIRATDGDNIIANAGQVTVTADATTAKRLETSITVYNTGDDAEPIAPPQTFNEDELPEFVDDEGNPLEENRTAYPEGTILFWTEAPQDEQDPNVGIEGAYYVVVVTEVDPDGPDGEQEPYDQWQWELTQQVFAETVTIVEDNFPSYAAANGNGLDGDGHAEGTGTTVAEARGIYLGDGDNVVDNRGDITVRAEAEARFQVSSDGDAFGDAVGISQAHAIARAYGIDLGNGNNRVYNDGTIDVTASPIAESRSEVSGGDICIWFFGWWCGGGGDGVGTSNASVYAESLGIHLGDGDNQVINDGTIIATAAPEIASSVNAGADSATVVAAVEAYATGIRAGDGDNVVFNNGSIEAHASSPSPPCVNCPPPANQLAAPIQAIGIQTGAGDDVIVNSGEIITSVQVVDVIGAGIAITTGAGNDVVALMPDSAATGSVDLGDGDDRLNLVESAVLDGDAMGGDGRDDIVFYGQGAYSDEISGFETATKYDAGTYTLTSLPTMNALAIYDGTLHVEDDYLFDDEGSALMRIHLDGFGQMWVDGMADLGGSLSVLAEHRAYHNGEVFPIIRSEELVDTFPAVSLPEARQLLRFELNYNDEDEQVEVLARTRPFRTVARNANERAIADYLDRIAPEATGEMSRVLGEFQTLQGNQFGEAFAGMSPASYGASTGAGLNTARLYSQVVSHRMQSLWSGAATRQAEASSSRLDGILLAYNGPNASLGNLVGRQAQADNRQRWGAWANVYGQWTTQDADDGFVGYDSDTYGVVLGMDYAFSETWLAGLSFGYASNDLNFDTNAGDGDIESYFGSLYTGWYRDAFYLESVLTYGSQAYDNKRNVVVGATRYTARSDHDGNLYSAYLGSGYNFGDDIWQIGPFVALEYLYLDEDGFEEKGAGVLNLIVDDRQTDALISQLGVRAARYFDIGLGALVPELSLAWLYDFDIDDRVITSSFAGASGDAFSITGQEVEQNGVVVGAALTLMQVSGIESSLTYSGEFRDGYDAHALIGQIRIAF